jgi:tetratricopeptide (TPR) repeat protein
MKAVSMSVVRVIPLAWALFGLPPWGSTTEIIARAQQETSDRQIEPADIESLKKTALQEAESGQTDDAIRDYQRVLAAQPDWKEGQWNLGMLEYQSGRYAQSKAAFQKVVEFAPNVGVAWAVLGLSEFEIKAYGESLAHLEKAQQLGTGDDVEIERVSRYHLGLLLIQNSDFERAADLLLKDFGGDLMSPQIKTALGLATLRIPLLPDEVDPSQEALIAAVGAAAGDEAGALNRYPLLLQTYPDVAYLHYAYGLELAKAPRDPEAIAAMRAETLISPDSPLPWIELSRIELRAGKVEDANTAAQKAVKLAPNSRAAHEALASCLDVAGERQAALAQRNLAARSMQAQTPELRIVLRYGNVAPGTAAASVVEPDLWNKAMSEYGGGQYAAAIPDLKAWLLQNPRDGTSWAVLGLSEFALHDFDSASIHLARGESLGLSGNAESLRLARYTLGILLIRAGEFDRGTEAVISACKLPPSDKVPDDKIEYALGSALLRRPELPGHASHEQASVILAAGKIRELLRSSEYDEAFARFRVLLQQNPNFPFLHYAYGTALLAMSEFDDAAVQMKIETTISPSSELPYVRLASIALRKHNPEDASAAAKHAVQLAPESAEAHYLLGRALLESGDYAAALPELLAAGKISPGSPEVHFNLAKAYARAKMPEQAERERAVFAQLNEAAEVQRRRQGNGSYQGPHDEADMSATGQASPAPPAAPAPK